MGRVVTFTAPRQTALAEYPDPALAPNQVRLATLYTGISAGTELTLYRGSNPYLAKKWHPESRLFVREESSSVQFPVNAWGYEEVGRVCEVGADVTQVKVGDVVWGAWGHRSTHVVEEEYAAQRLLAGNLDPICGIFSQIGAIALNAVLDADIHVGEYVAVFGQGVPGLIVTQLAKLNGATVIAVDTIPKRLDMAKACGADYVIDFQQQDPAEAIKALTGNRGADVSIEMTGFYTALNDAIRSTAYNSKVIASGFFQGEGKGLFLGEEFHHNRIQVICSQIFGVSPRLDHRWTRLRLDQTVMSLQAEGKLNLKQLISRVFPIEDVASAYQLLDTEPESALQVVLEF